MCCRVNGRLITVAQLRELGRQLLEHPRPARRPAAAGRALPPGLSGPLRTTRRRRWSDYQSGLRSHGGPAAEDRGSADGRGGESPADGQPQLPDRGAGAGRT
ncbi:MAG: hypothetical protein ACLRWQ_11955 [Flavonifractor plautii]